MGIFKTRQNKKFDYTPRFFMIKEKVILMKSNINLMSIERLLVSIA